MTVDFKLANVVLRVDDHAADHPELYYRAPRGAVHFDEGTRSLATNRATDFMTYVNACSASKWRTYAGVDTVWLHAEVRGAGELRMTGVPAKEAETASVKSKLLGVHELHASDTVALDIEVPTDGLDLVGFTLAPEGGSTVELARAWWYAKVDEACVNEVRLALATTTFKKEHYITANIDLVKHGVRSEGGPISEGFHMFVVDNGRTLDAEALSCDLVTVIPNPNVGGSGGFARGMMAATEVPGSFTHVLVMDDDVRIMPESLIRTYNLLSLASGPYRDAFINGAMLSLEKPTRQFEDVSFVASSGVYCRVKGDLYVDRLEDIVANERIDVEVPRAYGAWWYSCIPVSAIERNGLPLPLFIRCDDVEFGMRNDPTYMTMNGICVWHESFEGRFRASVDCYQYIRNFLTMIAVDDCASERLFMVRLARSVRQNLRDFDYPAAEMLLDGLEDYLKGPEHLQQLDGSAMMMANGARNEKLVPVEDMDPEVLAAAGVTEKVLAEPDRVKRITRLRSYLQTLPYDKHYLPDFLLGARPGYVVKNGASTLEGNSVSRKTIVFLDPTRTKGAVRHMDRARFRAICKRHRALMRRYRAEGGRVRAAFKEAFPYMTSREFWERYLEERS